MAETPSPINYKAQLFGFWSGVAYVVLLGIGFQLIAGYLPPHNPAATAIEVATIYQRDSIAIKMGMILCMFSAICYLPFSISIATELERIEGRLGMLSLSQLMGGMGTCVLTFYPAMWWLSAAYRVDRTPDLIMMLNDAAWLQFVGGLSMFMPCVLSIIAGSFADTRQHPVFPRWCAYFSIWLAIFVLPGQLVFFFYSGPFAWNGLFGFWLPVGALVVWLLTIAILLRQSALRLKKEAQSETPESPIS